MKYKERISNLLRKYETAPYNQHYLTLTKLQQHLIDDYYLGESVV